MNIEVGKAYKTQGGDIVTITSNVNESHGYNFIDPFFGVIKTESGEYLRLAYYSQSGSYCNWRKSNFDIVSELNHL